MLVKRTTFKHEVYGIKYKLMLFSDEQALGAFNKRKNPDMEYCELSGVVIYDVPTEDPYTIIIAYAINNLDYNTIIHETSHATWVTIELRYIGQDQFHENHANIEAFIAQKVMKFIVKNNIKYKL